MRQRWKVCVTSLFLFIVVYVGLIFVLYPEQLSKICILRPYVIVTDSMEPVLPVYTLVLDEPWSREHVPQKGDMITFQTEREGQSLIVTHFFDHEEVVDGTITYVTHAYEKGFDPFVLHQENMLGTVVYHIPYIGKLILYLQSSLGQYTICLDALIWLCFEIILRAWD